MGYVVSPGWCEYVIAQRGRGEHSWHHASSKAIKHVTLWGGAVHKEKILTIPSYQANYMCYHDVPQHHHIPSRWHDTVNLEFL